MLRHVVPVGQAHQVGHQNTDAYEYLDGHNQCVHVCNAAFCWSQEKLPCGLLTAEIDVIPEGLPTIIGTSELPGVS